MKKVKFMLIAITVFAAVGGSLAFKAKKFSFQTIYTTNGGTQCTVSTTNVYTTTTDNVNGLDIQYSTQSGSCVRDFKLTTSEVN